MTIHFESFKNDGFGWNCKACSSDEGSGLVHRVSRIFLEGEAESKTPVMAGRALAKWVDRDGRKLRCGHCGIEETATEG
jgi:hypothetical protein